jgi:hypothetical protein
MAKFRKKPVVIEAEQWYEGVEIEGVKYSDGVGDVGRPYWYVPTLEGRMVVSPGDWIITGVKGEKYPCKPDIFEATYEIAEG